MNDEITSLEKLIALGLPFLSAKEANAEIARLHVRIMELEAERDRDKLLKLWDER